jgi:hypothetical protein
LPNSSIFIFTWHLLNFTLIKDFKLKSKFNLTFRQLFSYSNYACKLGISQVKEVGIQTITKIEKAQQFPLKAAVENHLRFSPLNLI